MIYKLYIETFGDVNEVREFDCPVKAVKAGVKFVPHTLPHTIGDQEESLCVAQLMHWNETTLYQNDREGYKVYIARIMTEFEASQEDYGPF